MKTKEVFRNKLDIVILVTFALGLCTWIYNAAVIVPDYDSDFLFDLACCSRDPLILINHLVSCALIVEVVIKLIVKKLIFSSGAGKFFNVFWRVIIAIVFIAAMILQMLLAWIMFSGLYY